MLASRAKEDAKNAILTRCLRGHVHDTMPVYEVTRITIPNAMRYHANGVKS